MLSKLSFALLATTLCLTGCSMERTQLAQSAVDVYPSPEDELDFLDQVETLSVITNSDALHGLFMLDGEPIERSFEEHQAEAIQRGWIDEDTTLAPNESARIGMIAIAICNLLDIQGGLSMRLFGPNPRACTRELVYLELIPLRTENQSLSGYEFIDLLSRVERDMIDPDMTPVFNEESDS